MIHRISSLDLPTLQPYRTLRRPLEHLEQGIFVAEGEKVVRRLLASGLPIVSMLLSNEWHERMTANLHDAGFDVFVAEKGLLETIVGFRMHQGIMAVARVPVEPSLDDLVKAASPPRLFVALDGLVFAENVGVVVRNCAAFGVQGILAGGTSASPYLRRAVRNSMGTVFKVPILHMRDLAGGLSRLSSNLHVAVVIADAHTSDSIYDVDCRGDLCVVFGNEDAGVSAATREVATTAVRIPMNTGVDSLNVASASAVILAEISRRRSSPQQTDSPQ